MPVSLQPVHDSITIDQLNDKVMRQQETMWLALEALQEWERVDVLGREPFVHRESWKEAVQQRNQNHTAAIAALEAEGVSVQIPKT